MTSHGPAPHAGPHLHGYVHGGPDGSAGQCKWGTRWRCSGSSRAWTSLATLLDTIPYELTCAVSKRVPRLYLENGQVTERSLRLLV